MTKVVPMHGFGGGGALLNFNVVGGTAEPAYPRENIIWVNTSTPITDWVFSTAQPTGTTGRVWIQIGTVSTVAFNALKNNNITVYPTSAKQYVSGAWVNVTAKSYQGGAWVDWFHYLYNSGNECTSATGGWSAYAVPTNSDAAGGIRTITKGTTSMSIAPQSGKGGIVRTVNKVNITSEMKSLVFNGTLYSDSKSNSQFWCSICVWSDIGSYASQNVVAVYHHGTGDAFTGTKTIDVSSLNGTYYVGFSLYGLSELSVTSLHLK